VGYWRFRRRLKLIPGLFLHLSKRGVRGTASLPGSGISYVMPGLLNSSNYALARENRRHDNNNTAPATGTKTHTVFTSGTTGTW
jgi:hypothetical protein